MKLPKMMTASFEESLALQDDDIVKYMIKDVERPGIREKPILVKILAVVMIVILFGIAVFVTTAVKVGYSGSPIPKPKINFLSIELFLILFIMYNFIWCFTLFKRSTSTKFFFSYINTTNILRWMILEINLTLLTMFLIPMTVFGVISFIFVIVVVGFIIVEGKVRALNKQLFDAEIASDKVDIFIKKIIKIIMKYGWLAVIGVVLWKFIFPNTTGVRTDIVGFIGVISLWLILDIGIIVMEMYLFL